MGNFDNLLVAGVKLRILKQVSFAFDLVSEDQSYSTNKKEVKKEMCSTVHGHTC